MSNPTSLPIARLRAAGNRVSTLLGHDPNIGDFKYRVTLLDGTTRVIESCVYRVGQKTDPAVRDGSEQRAARRLAGLADEVGA